ncbi:MAG: rRNA methyltransferase, partial [Microbacteriaceae bacterium]|nr:rRNA methyltransferase [Microbacteriaceae bacterium]
MAHVYPISDLSDPRISDYVNLTDVALRRKSEPANGLYIAESSKVIRRALTAGHVPRSVLTAQRWLDEMVELFREFDVPLFVGSAETVELLTGFHLHRGA